MMPKTKISIKERLDEGMCIVCTKKLEGIEETKELFYKPLNKNVKICKEHVNF